MKQKTFYSFLLTGMVMLAAVSFVSCEEDLTTEVTTVPITIVPDNSDFADGTVARTRGTKVTAISGLGISASVYSAASTYISAGCGSYFFNESVTAGIPTVHYWPTADYRLSFFGYYPYNNAALTVQSTANTTGAPTYTYTVPSVISSQLDVMTGQTTDILGGGTSPVTLTMKHRCAAICFNVTNSRSTAVTLTSISIEGVKYSGTLNGDTWTLSSSVNSSSTNPFTLAYGSSIAASATANVTGTSNIFFMLPQTIPAGAKLKVVVDGSEEMEAELTGTWVAGKQYNYGVDIANNKIVVVDEDSDIEDWKEKYINLSMIDNAGNDRASMTTANCYLIHEAGKYMLPLVYGNAIKNGAVNTIAFNPGTVTNGTDRFVNHNGDGITGPWITKSTSGTGVDKGMGLTAASAELLWQDVASLISAVSIDGDYLKFTVGTFNPGNAHIAVKDGSGTVLWSWHIWATTETLASTTAISTGAHTYNVAPVNLGWVPTGGDGKQGRSTLYQWGRKDAFMPAVDNLSNVNATVYDISNNDITPATIDGTSTGIQYEVGTSFTIADNIKNPIKLYRSTDVNGPCSTIYYNMWDAQNSSVNNVTTATKKTIYDPCPPGFCVPTGNLYYHIGNANKRTMNTFDSTNKGAIWLSTGLWFPCSGSRNPNSGALQGSGVYGYYYSATPNNTSVTNYVSLLRFTSSTWDWTYNSRQGAMAIRPVVEE